MVALWGGIALLSLVIAVIALRRSFKLGGDVERLRRAQYYVENQAKRLPDQILEAVEPLRHQVAKIAEGGRVIPDMIRNGRLYQEISAEDARKLLEETGAPGEGRVFVLDVRSPQEYAARRVPGATVVPVNELETRCRTAIPETADRVLVYCEAGDRSRIACDFLSRRGYTNLYNMYDGLQAWKGKTEGEGRVNLIQLRPRSKDA